MRAFDALRLGGDAARVPLILQTEAAECGLACLAMVASAPGAPHRPADACAGAFRCRSRA